ncbi:ATP-binding cassette domain-containing protein [Clostridium sp.]
MVALDSFTFDVNDYEIVCLLGPNDTGKTTLIKCLSGLVAPDSGEIYIADVKINTKSNELFDINDLLNRKVNTLSLGQKQKVSILANILLMPKILVLDEPSNRLYIEAKEMYKS